MKKIDLVILAGGKGSRIKNFLVGKPKPMLKFNNKYFLSYIIQFFGKYNFNNIYILTGYRYQIIFQKFHNKKFNFIPIKCLNEKRTMGTGGALNSLKRVKNLNDFVLVNGDTIFKINPLTLIKSKKNKSLGTVALIKKNKSFANNIKLNNLGVKKNLVFFSKIRKLINGGIYFFNKTIINHIPNNFCSLEDEIIPRLITEKKLNGIVFKNFFLDIGSSKSLKISPHLLKNNFTKPAVFLDRDGVINHDYGYVYKINRFKIKNNVLKALKFISNKGYYIFIVTNQAGIAKKKFKLSDFEKLHIYLKSKLSNYNVFLDDVKFSPFHPSSKIKKYKINSQYRKPGNLMIKEIFKNWDIDHNKSFMIGDKKTDKLAALKSNLYFEYDNDDLLKQFRKIYRKLN